MPWIKGSELSPELRRHALNAFPFRMTHESVQRWPECSEHMRKGGYRMPLKSDAEWLEETGFYVTIEGHLSERHRYCQPWHLVAA